MNKPSFVYVTYIRSTPEKIWSAITDREIAGQYWGGGCHTNVSDWKVGSKWEHQRNDGSGVVDIVGTVTESNRPRRLALTWAAPDGAADPERTSRVVFEIDPHKDDVARLTVTHSELEPGSQMLQGITFGWPLVLSSLKSFLETGKVVPK
jgi:uncharacterized protein YndB with AHSA1/START domain